MRKLALAAVLFAGLEVASFGAVLAIAGAEPRAPAHEANTASLGRCVYYIAGTNPIYHCPGG